MSFYKSRVPISDKKKECLVVEILGEEYEICDSSSSNLWANSKTGFYGSGILNKKTDPRRTERIGLLGEMAFSKITKLPYDFTYKIRGKTEDFIFNGKTIDVKTSAKYPNYESGLIYAQNEKGKLIKIKPDYFVFSFIMEEDREKKIAKICFVGYTNREYIQTLPIVKARQGFHKNYEVPFLELKSINQLLKKITKNKEK